MTDIANETQTQIAKAINFYEGGTAIKYYGAILLLVAI